MYHLINCVLLQVDFWSSNLHLNNDLWSNMADSSEGGGSEQDDVSFLRTVSIFLKPFYFLTLIRQIFLIDILCFTRIIKVWLIFVGLFDFWQVLVRYVAKIPWMKELLFYIASSDYSSEKVLPLMDNGLLCLIFN